MRDIDIIYPKEAANLSKASLRDLVKWKKSGKLKPKSHYFSGATIYRRSDIERFLGLKKDSLLPQPSDRELADAANMCLGNCESLLKDSEGLYSNGSFGTALSVCAIALEELSKAVSCLDPIVQRGGGRFSWSKFWSEFYEHSTKLRNINVYLAIALILGKYGKFGITHPKAEKDINWLEKYGVFVDMQKQNGFYVDYLKSPQKVWFDSPNNMVRKSEAETLIRHTRGAVTLIEKQKLFSKEVIERIRWTMNNPLFKGLIDLIERMASAKGKTGETEKKTR